MSSTVYTFHRASDHSIINTAAPATLNNTAAQIAERIHRGLPDRDLKSTRIYVHNGAGVIAAGLCRQGLWHDILRDDYRQFDAKAREQRTAAGWPNDEREAGR